GVLLHELALLATVQELSSRPGCASGVSSWYTQLLSVGRLMSGGPASWSLASRPPALVGVAATGCPFQVTVVAPGAHTSSGSAVAVSPVRSTVEPSTLAVRRRSGPRTMTGPAAVSSRQKLSAEASSPKISSSGLVPPPVTSTSVRPFWV